LTQASEVLNETATPESFLFAILETLQQPSDVKSIHAADFQRLLYEVSTKAEFSETIAIGLETLSIILTFSIDDPIVVATVGAEVHDAIVSIIESPKCAELQLCAITALRNVLTYSADICGYCCRASRFPAVCMELMNTADDPGVVSGLVGAVMTIVTNLNGSCSTSDVGWCADVLLRALTINSVPEETALKGLSAYVARCGEFGASLVRTYQVMRAFQTMMDSSAALAFVDFVAITARNGSPETRVAVISHIDWPKWAEVGESDSAASVWALQTSEVVSYSNNLISESGMKCIISQLVQIVMSGSFEARKAGAVALAKMSDLLSRSMLVECATEGLVAALAELAVEETEEESDEIVQLLTRTIQACCELGVSAEIFDQLPVLDVLCYRHERLVRWIENAYEAAELG
jgi:hypothetical protein